jgi:acetoin:2,6-dichlorophenolindophenol oxidoreductase subunit beta
MRRIAYSIALREAMEEEMDRDPSVFLMGEDIAEYGGCFGVTRGLVERFGRERVRNTPISENGYVGLGVGAAMLGMRPVVEIMFMDFLTLAMDQLVNHAAKFHYVYAGRVKVPLVLRTAAGAGRGYGATHSQSLEAWLLSVPGLKVVAPAFPQDAKGLLKSAIRDDGPVVFIEHKTLYGHLDHVTDDEELTPIGKARVIRRGSDVTLVSYSRMAHEALKAAEALEAMGISAEVIDLRTLHPLDLDTVLESVHRTGRAVLAEEGVSRWGVCAEISCQITEHGFQALRAPVRRVGLPDIPIPCGFEQEQLVLPGAAEIVKAVEGLMRAGTTAPRHAARVDGEAEAPPRVAV